MALATTYKKSAFHLALTQGLPKPHHVLASDDLTPAEIRQILDLAHELKAQRKLGLPIEPKEGLSLGMIFEKQSLRTRVSFELAFQELGGHAVYLTKGDIDMGNRESIADTAQVLSNWCTLIVARLYSHEHIEELAAHSSVPVVNALTDQEHPCQALADLMTLEEEFGKDKLKLAYIGDGNNVANSFAVTAAKLGHEVNICTPPGYEAGACTYCYANIHHGYSPHEAVLGADAVYTDVWVSMGQEDEEELRMSRFAKYQVNADLMKQAKKSAVFLHCLPARRGLEVTEEVIDGPQSMIFEQSDNRLHTQKALMMLLLEKGAV